MSVLRFEMERFLKVYERAKLIGEAGEWLQRRANEKPDTGKPNGYELARQKYLARMARLNRALQHGLQ